uniref:Uncharacterized protein n=1 Tax=Tanacetum cinerariifolium TaxID=118510 RepID=A0A6L2N9X7_TANCI|nr:hypothetical protein [Tanacetum cinerariifolium]
MNGWIEADVPLLGELGEMGEPDLGDLAMLFGDDDFRDDGPDDDEDDEEVWEVGGPSTATTEGHSLTFLAPGVPVPPSVIEDLCTRMGNLEYGHGQLVKKVIKVSNAEVADGIGIGETGPRVSAVEGHVHVMASQMVQAVGRLEQVGTRMEQDQQDTTQRDEMIFGLSQQPRGYFDAILRMDRRLADLERRPPGPQ